MISTQKLTKTYGTATRVVALDQVDLQIESGERVALLGRSGSGKTTLLNLLAGLDRPTSGSICVDDVDLHSLNPKQLADYRLRKIGVIFQSFQLIPTRTAIQNVELPLVIAGVKRRERKERAQETLSRVGLEKRIHHRPYQLSGGEQQRVAIARAIVNRPRVLLADEPTGNLDSAIAEQVTQLLLEIIAEQKSTFVLITHDRLLATACAERILQMTDGRISDNAAHGMHAMPASAGSTQGNRAEGDACS
jgi:ABC-type lipoprotein export system ATPase subunit